MSGDRDRIVEAHSKGRRDDAGQTQCGRALEALGSELIRAYSPQAQGRLERFFETAPVRWVKELRLAGVATRAQANALVRPRLQREFNRRFPVPAQGRRDARREPGAGHNLAATLSVQARRVVSNDCTSRFEDRLYQLEPPGGPGERGGRVVIELRLAGAMALRFRGRYLKFHEVSSGVGPSPPREGEGEGVPAEGLGGASARRRAPGRDPPGPSRPAALQP